MLTSTYGCIALLWQQLVMPFVLLFCHSCHPTPLLQPSMAAQCISQNAATISQQHHHIAILIVVYWLTLIRSTSTNSSLFADMEPTCQQTQHLRCHARTHCYINFGHVCNMSANMSPICWCQWHHMSVFLALLPTFQNPIFPAKLFLPMGGVPWRFP